jgi:hypothetical protein
MKSISTTTNQGQRGPSSLRKIRRGILLGLAGACLLIILAERRAQQAAREIVMVEARARPYTGPAPVLMKSTVGGVWMSLANSPQLPLKAERAQNNPLVGSGYSSGRGGPGSPWGPLGETANAPLPMGAWGGFNAPLARRVQASMRVYPLIPRLLVVTDSGYNANKDTPRSLRYKYRYD